MGALDQPRSHLQIDEEATLAARAAWLYFAGGQTQGEIAEKLNVPSTKAHRLIARASRDGLIRVFVEGPIAGCVGLEEKLKEHYGLGHCEVVPNIDEGALPLRTLGMAGARYLRNVIDRGVALSPAAASFAELRLSVAPSAQQDEPLAVRREVLASVVPAAARLPTIVTADATEAAAFLEIRDLRKPGAPAVVFSGWMFASTPALSALEHPIYDVWVLDCKNISKSSAPKP